MMFPSSLSAAHINSIIINGAPVCLPLRPSVCLSAGRFRKPNPAQLGTAPACLPPSPSVPRLYVTSCPGSSRAKLHLRDGGKREEKKRREKGEKREMRERKRYSQSSTRPLRCSLSPSLPLSVYVALPEPLPPAAAAL